MTEKRRRVPVNLGGVKYAVQTYNGKNPLLGEFQRYRAEKIGTSKEMKIDRYNLGFLDGSGKPVFMTVMPQSLPTKAKKDFLSFINGEKVKKIAEKRGKIEYESSTYSINGITYNIRGYAKWQSELGETERYILEYRECNRSPSIISVEKINLTDGPPITVVNDVPMSAKVNGVPSTFYSNPSLVVKSGLSEAIEEHKSGYGRGNRNDSRNYFLGQEKHRIAGREYCISAPKITLCEGGLFRKEYVIQTLGNPRTSHIILLALLEEKDGVKKIWSGARSETERRDLEMIIKPHLTHGPKF